MEEMLINHLGFMRFVGLSVEQDVPDETTICRFRNGLVSHGILEKINEMVLLQLEQSGVLVREGALVDATVVESACRPRKTIEVMPEDRKEDDLPENNAAQSVTISFSATKFQTNKNPTMYIRLCGVLFFCSLLLLFKIRFLQ